MSLNSWIGQIQGITTVLDALGSALMRRQTIQFIGADAVDDGTKTVVTIGGGSGSGIQGRLLRAPQVLTSGTSINHPAGTRIVKVRGVGASGAAGGTNAATFSVGAASGSGTYGEKTYTNAALTSTYTIGAAGTGVSGAAGNNGTASTFTNNGVTVTLPGSAGGGFRAGASGAGFAFGGVGGGAATNADFSIPGQVGSSVMRLGSNDCFSTTGGGSNPLGIGAPGALLQAGDTVAATAQGTGFGAGSRGALNGTTASATAGAAGLPGCWIVEEYS